jgi:nitroreductase
VETWDAIRSRRNVRDYAERPIAPHELDQVLDAGRRAPSSRNWQPWDLVVVSERDRLHELARVWRGASHVARSAATVALIAPVPGDEREGAILHYDLGQATMSMMIAAADLGIGSGHAAVMDQDLARALLGHPPDRFCAYLLALGYPREPLRPLRRLDRRPFDEVVHRERW